jgi:hypothetical protein
MNKSLYVLPLALMISLCGAAHAEDATEGYPEQAIEDANSAQDPIAVLLASEKAAPAKVAKEVTKASATKHKSAPVPLPVPRPKDLGSDLPKKPAVHQEPNWVPNVAINPNLPNPLWGATAERRMWTFTVEGVVAARLSDLELAKDKESFCPGYNNASRSQKVNCWVMIVSSISKFESGFKTGDSFRETDGNNSIGLLALSPGECPNAKTARALSGAQPNLTCGVNMMAKLVGHDHYISGPSEHRGAARYWSTLRAPYTVYDKTRHKNLHLGYRTQIVGMVKGYRGNGKPPAVDTTCEVERGPGELFEAADRDELDKEHVDMTGDRDFFEPRF